jgi:hypothetical protein
MSSFFVLRTMKSWPWIEFLGYMMLVSLAPERSLMCLFCIYFSKWTNEWTCRKWDGSYDHKHCMSTVSYLGFFLISQAPILKDPSWFAGQKLLSLKSLVVRAFPEFSIVHEVHSFLRHPHVCPRSPIIQLRVRTELLDYKWIVYLSLSV